MRKWHSPEVPADDDWAVNNKTVVLKIYRLEILFFAHKMPMAGHLGVSMLSSRIIFIGLVKREMFQITAGLVIFVRW